MRKLFFMAGCFISIQCVAKNVGIGTSTPGSRLTVSGSEATFNGLNATIQINNTAPGGGSWYLRSGATGTGTPAGGFSIANSLEYLFCLDNAGKLGLGLVAPAEKIHSNLGNIRLDASDKGIMLNAADRAMITRAFDPFTSGVHNGLGRWGLFMEPNNLTLGLPNMPGKEVEVAKFNPDGTKIPVFSVSGEGSIKLFDNAGASGQVLTSNGASAATWKNTALSNSVRFSVNYTSSSGTVVFPPFSLPARYNLDPASISIAATGITLTKGGLYHFDIYMNATTGFTAATAPEFTPSVLAELDIDQPANYPVIAEKMQGRENYQSVTDWNFDFSKLVSIELYVAPGSVVRLRTAINAFTAGGYYTFGYINGHLISE
ncbi:MAG: hypothetical protein EOO13_12700 [Chitinophagaceae bacterium]|nr:MAG: hypothetical protein EOO13_12700 [Chitinophagaceae bacterium]